MYEFPSIQHISKAELSETVNVINAGFKGQPYLFRNLRYHCNTYPITNIYK